MDLLRFGKLFEEFRETARHEWQTPKGQLRRKLSRERLAELIGVGSTTVYSWEKGRSLPNDRTVCVEAIRKIAVCGGIPSPKEANDLLSLADWTPLSEDEIRECFPTYYQENLVTFSAAPQITPEREQLEEWLNFDPPERFVNLSDQRARFQKMLNESRSQVMLIQVEGRKGKTFLLKRLAHICREQGHDYSYIDLQGGLIVEPRKIMRNIGRHSGLIEDDASVNDLILALRERQRHIPDRKFVLLIDSINDAKELVPWLIKGLLEPIRPDLRRLPGPPQIINNLIVVIAGNEYVPDLVKNYGWEEDYVHFDHDLLWTKEDMQEYSKIRYNKEISKDVDVFYKISKGNPSKFMNDLHAYMTYPVESAS